MQEYQFCISSFSNYLPLFIVTIIGNISTVRGRLIEQVYVECCVQE